LAEGLAPLPDLDRRLALDLADLGQHPEIAAVVPVAVRPVRMPVAISRANCISRWASAISCLDAGGVRACNSAGVSCPQVTAISLRRARA